MRALRAEDESNGHADPEGPPKPSVRRRAIVRQKLRLLVMRVERRYPVDICKRWSQETYKALTWCARPFRASSFRVLVQRQVNPRV